MQFTISARGKKVDEPVLQFLAMRFGNVSIRQVDSIFGFVERCSMYGGRIYNNPELSPEDITVMYAVGIGLRLPLTNHNIDRDEYCYYNPMLEKYHKPGNSVITVNDDLAIWIREDFPGYQLEASVIKNLNTVDKVVRALEIYDTVVLPMECNEQPAFLRTLPDKKRIRLFANAGCALTCPSKICYPSISKINKFQGGEFKCSQSVKERELIGMHDFDLGELTAMGYERFKLLRSRPGGMTGF
jgi:hypothetical protein